MDPRAQAQARIGATLCNKWKLEKLLGVGGMAAVYVASHKIGRRDAIKILHREIAQAPDMRARFEQEAQVVNRFIHPGAVEIRDIDVTEDGAPFLVMELLSGESLAERAQRLGGIELPELLRFADELLDVLAAAHEVGIIHRDIKLENLFIQTDGRLKVLDFGIARMRDGLPTQARTLLGATLGTASYMPPEQIKGLEIDARADLFAVGATLFRIIAKRRIHEAPNDPQLLIKMANEQAPSLLSVAPSTPVDVAQVIDRSLMFDREQRYPSAISMQSDIRAIREGKAPISATARAPAPAMSRPPRETSIPSDEATRINPGPANAALSGPVSSEAPTPIGGALGAMAPTGAPPEPATSDVVARDSPTMQRYAGKPFMIGAEPTLRSQEPQAGPVIPSSMTTPRVEVLPPRSALSAESSGADSVGHMGTLIMAKSASGKASPPSWRAPKSSNPAMSSSPPNNRPRRLSSKVWQPERRRVVQLVLLGGVFMLLGVFGTMCVLGNPWADTGAGSASSASPLKTAAPLGSPSGAPLPRPPAIVGPASSTPKPGKGTK